MGKLVVSQFMTLDGVIEAPGGGESFEHGGWAFEFDRCAEGDRFKPEELQKAAWTSSTVIRRDVVEEIAELKHWHEGDILVNGSPGLVWTLMDHDLIDGYQLMVFPVVLNNGKRLFGDSGRMARLRLVDATPVGPDGVIVLTYEPAAKTDRAEPTTCPSQVG